MKLLGWLKKPDPVKQFAEELISNCHRLANDHSKQSSFTIDKYKHLRDFVQILVFNCYSLTTILENNGAIDKKKFSFVFFEHLNLYIFWVDRIASDVFTTQQRSQLMRELTDLAFFSSIETLSPDIEDNAKDTLYRQCMNNLIAVIKEYSKYKLIQTENDSGSENTVIWEFSKKIQEFTKDPHNLGGMIGYGLPVLQALKNIDIKTFLNKIKQ
jgi:hypothetical protein